MNEAETFVVGAALPRIRSVYPERGLRVAVVWQSDGPEAASESIDLAPAISRYRVFAPLRGDEGLFCTVRIVDDGFAIAWDHDDLDMASTMVAHLALHARAAADAPAP